MSGINRPAGTNRTLLGLTGAVLVAAGALLIAAHFGRLAAAGRDEPLVPGTGAPPTWVLVIVIAAGLLAALLCLRWLLAQAFRMPKARAWEIGTATGAGVTTLDTRTAAAPVADDIETYPGVRSASAWLTGTGTEPELHLVVTAEPTADIAELRRRILGHAVARLREALEVSTVPVTLELRFDDGRRGLAR
ncbi:MULTISPECIES: Asp23/Gls24 family envelope stress response protein [Nocardia]|uniref:Alkaline shock response membrane anchor protein AmaP n=2 Tax=Nocardia farcinica TaxID=37329 RepID=Q5YXA1_NOCFA|nr:MULTISPECIES: hypothetical protein [Nocardia]MBA4855525.1 alkaline shock response membrane anchor protein AmaP [Nocardia farcinica]MBC9818136.1 alkaline shock response membrane anchor protein AmaP [Nocardia farcinica]MBF6184612.1 alkaline shock response membrane anchor protein AmaP [Nocardia farcinica]MBF6231042.1 alkaline shock response membrane anchor protein AmaP [Nocardia farcinica]MBF6310456.1 alkaline shock response membrane anchor protein AmaP [Nocardia farcinica]